MKTLKKLTIEIFQPGEFARRVISRSRSRPTFKVPGDKRREMHPAESPLEVDAIALLDSDPTVTTFQMQPAIISMEFDDDGKLETQKHYPDSLVTRRNDKGFIEVKSQAEAVAPDVVGRTAIMKEELPHHGYWYDVWTETEIRVPKARLDNAKFLLRYGRNQVVSELDREHIRRAFAKSTDISWGDAMRGTLGPKGPYQVCRLILDGILEIDRSAPISVDTVIRWRAAEFEPPSAGDSPTCPQNTPNGSTGINLSARSRDSFP